MNIDFEQMLMKHAKDFLDIYNYYIKNTNSIFLEHEVSIEVYKMFIYNSLGYPAYAMKYNEQIIGFCFLTPYKPTRTFMKCAEMTILIHRDYTKGRCGWIALRKLESDAYNIGIRNIILHTTSENEMIKVKGKLGYKVCGRLEKVIEMKQKKIDLIIWQKELSNIHKKE